MANTCRGFGDVHQVSSVQSLSHVRLFVTPWTAVRQASLSISNSQSLLKSMSIQSGMPSNHLILYHPCLLLPSIFPSIRVFSNESVLPIRWPKYWSFSFSTTPCNEYSGLISFRIDLFVLLAVQGILKSLLQHHNSGLGSALPIQGIQIRSLIRELDPTRHNSTKKILHASSKRSHIP